MPSTKTLVSIVDDDQSISRMLGRVLTAAGFQVVSFGSAEEFLDLEQPEESACLILDMNLPGMSGINLQRHLNDAGRNIPIIFISADADEAAQQRALDAGAVAFLSKPFSVDALLEKLRSVAVLELI